ncbi:DNA primase [Bacillus phage TsarBomba]|uniref:DNA primase n=1 Tax=Bacillus phage TsarBomba TaxID=1690456 RepID=A0A0K2CZV8_9CAUD|nr:DNA primase [Bacillus phage TsarBomba]ALA13003.1 DNA primase [Bacillus phage TsarBomba]
MFLDIFIQELGDSKPAGNETRFNCPFCGNTKYKLYVENRRGLWQCKRCGEDGNPVTFVMKYYGVDFAEAAEILEMYDYDVKAQRKQNATIAQYGSDLSEAERLLLFINRRGAPLEEEQPKIRYTFPRPPTNCKTLINNFNNPEAYPFFMYLHGRGITLEQIKEHNISYVTRGEVELVDGRKLILVNHVVFFTFDEKRKPLYWNTRSIEQSPSIKSFNAPAKETEYSKKNVIFNLNNARKCKRIVISEGVFDALTIGQEGVATFGKKITAEQVDLLLEKTKVYVPIYLYLDRNATKEMIDTSQMIHAKQPERPVYYVYSPTDDDANKLGQEKAHELISQAILADGEGELKLRLWTIKEGS